MNIKEILRIKRYPFKVKSNDCKKYQNVKFIIMLRYCEKLISQYHLDISIPTINYLIYEKKSLDKPSILSNKDISKIFCDIMKELGWTVLSINRGDRFDKLDQILPEGSRKDDEILKYLSVFKDKVVGVGAFNYETVYLCWNYKIASYLLKSKKKYLLKEDKEIRNIIKKINYPFKSSYHRLIKDRYVIGFSTCGSPYGLSSVWDIDPNFFINLLVLDILLEEVIGT